MFSNRPTLNSDGSVPGDWYDESYWERGAESGKGSYNTNEYSDNVAACKLWATDCYNRWGPFTSFLELGCGRGWNGYGFLHLPELAVQYLGMDISQYAINTANPLIRPHLMVGDISDLHHFHTGEFDTIFSNDVLEHLTPTQAMQCLMGCNRIAKKHIAHLISIADGVDLPDGQVPPDQDQSHILLRSIGWWANLFNRVFGGSFWITEIAPHGRTVEFHLTRQK